MSHPSAYRSVYGPTNTAHYVTIHLLNSSSFHSGPPRPAGRRAVQSMPLPPNSFEKASAQSRRMLASLIKAVSRNY